MLKQRSDQAFLAALCGADVLMTVAMWVGAYFVRWKAAWLPNPIDMPPIWWCVRSIPIVVIAAVVSYQFAGLYQLKQRWSLLKEAIRLLRATTLMLLIVLAQTFYFREPYESRLASVLFWIMTFCGLIVLRRCLGAFFRYRRRRGFSAGHALIVGTGRTARGIDAVLRANNWLSIQPMGFVDEPQASSKVMTVGAIADMPRLIDEYEIDYVFIALPLRRYAEARRVMRTLADSLVEVLLVPDVPMVSAMTLQTEEIEGLPVLSLRSSPHAFAELVAKRVIDVVLASIGLIVLSPMLGLIALLVKLTSPGPIFYAQERMGLNGHRFKMLKFRSMRIDAEKESGPVWAKESDPRRTRFGAFLRRTSLDEFPQLFNVLKGDMSLVGPRPERPHFINNFRLSIPRYMRRHAVKAGITGWAQVNGWRGNTSLRKRVQYDLYYISNWSIWLDFRILFMTIRAMFDKHAY